ncbi:MAG TPA: copper chaperone PCu(A)C, partial [Rhodospirillaceae bacterium]|nr:copper chaperone PCu(A)C [Rhodospirillaceae bacterium]
LKAPFKEGDSFPLTLVFEKAGKIGVSVTIMKAGAMGGMKMKRTH